MSEILTFFFRHHHWANLTLLDFCAQLSPQQLAAEAPRTVGTIHQTLHHIAVNEERYLTVFDSAEVDVSTPQELPDLATLRQQLDRNGRRLIELAATLKGDPAYATQWQGQTVQVPARLPLLQAINHGTEHRGQIVSALHDMGVEPPGLDAWAYAAAQGQ